MASGEEQLTQLVGRVFSDPSFARAMEQNPEKALKDAGYQLNAEQLRAVQSSGEQVHSLAPQDAQHFAFVRPVVNVVTKGTKPVVSVVTNSAVVASASAKPEEKK